MGKKDGQKDRGTEKKERKTERVRKKDGQKGRDSEKERKEGRQRE